MEDCAQAHGAYYKGTVINGLRDGFGTYKSVDNKYYEGDQYKNSKLNQSNYSQFSNNSNKSIKLLNNSLCGKFL